MPAPAKAEATPAPRAHRLASAPYGLVAVAVLAGAVWAVYGRSVDAPFVFDDKVSIIGNTSIEQLWPLVGDAEHPGPLRPPHHTPVAGRPLVNLSLALNYHYGQLNPYGYHVLNMCLHVLTALLVFALVRRTLWLPYFQGRFDRAAGPLALVVALLWALHPLQTETVVYVTQRTELMVALFYLATLYGSLRYWQAATPRARVAWLAAATLASLAGMATKEIMVSVPVVVLLYERAFLAGSLREAWRRSWPLYASLAATWIVLVALNLVGPRSDSAGFHLGIPVLNWWYTQSWVMWMYLKLVVWPWPLAIHYDMPYLDTLATAWPWVLGVAVLAAASIVLLWRNHPVGFLAAWIAAILAPTFVIPISTEMAAERRMYLPLAMLTVLVVVGGYGLVQRATWRLDRGRAGDSSRRWPTAVAACGALVLVLGASVVSAHRLAVYQDPLALWQDTVKSQPLDPMAHYNLGVELADRDRVPEAIACCRRAIELKKRYGNAYYNLGNLLSRIGRPEEAIAQYRRALEIHPDDADALFNLGLAQANGGDTAAALANMQQALALRPDDADFHAHLGKELAKLGRTREALARFEKAIDLNPDVADVRRNYGAVLLTTKRLDEAILQLRRAVDLDPDDASSYDYLAVALANSGKLDEAVVESRRLVQRQPTSANSRRNLGALLLRANRPQEAIAELQAALKLDPGATEVREVLAHTLRQAGQFQAAIDQYEQILQREPENLDALGGLAETCLQTNQTDKAVSLTLEAIRIARDKGENELADRIETWLTGFQAELTKPRDGPAAADGAP